MIRVFSMVFFLAVSGCAVLEKVQGGDAGVVETTPLADDPSGAQVRPQARPDTGQGLSNDTAQSAPEASVGTLGRTVASLGNAGEPGLWLKTPLVTSQRPGTVYYPATNKSVKVTLIPIDGPATAGSRLSLQAMQELGAPLTGLPEVDVLAG